jgi:hypothetical protein
MHNEAYLIFSGIKSRAPIGGGWSAVGGVRLLTVASHLN